MIHRWLGPILALVLSASGISSSAQAKSETGRPVAVQLGLSEVLASVDATHPELAAAGFELDAARAKQEGARGAWDPVVSVATRWAPVGYYQNGSVNAQVRQATPLLGLGVYAGYRMGWGSFPIYKGEQRTLPGGELRAGIDLPFWRGAAIDERRANIERTSVAADASECERRSTGLELRLEAARAYWQWVAAGQEVRIQRELLDVARQRDAGLRERAALGSISDVVVLDNQRLVLERRAELVAAERDFSTAALELSLFLRDQQRNPVRAPETRVPSEIPVVHVELPELRSDVAFAIRQRPETCTLMQTKSAAQIELALQKNQVAPAINGKAYVARDLGRGSAELAPTEFAIGLTIEMPVALRSARGARRAAQAEVSRLDAQLRALYDRIGADVRKARVDLEATEQQVTLTEQQVEVARRLAEAERERFRQGASDLVVVNLRELTAARAPRLEVEARAAHQKAFADYSRVLGRPR